MSDNKYCIVQATVRFNLHTNISEELIKPLFDNRLAADIYFQNISDRFTYCPNIGMQRLQDAKILCIATKASLYNEIDEYLRKFAHKYGADTPELYYSDEGVGTNAGDFNYQQYNMDIVQLPINGEDTIYVKKIEYMCK